MVLPKRAKLEDVVFKLEEERRERRLHALDLRFQSAIHHVENVSKINEECYQAKRAFIDAAKSTVKYEPAKGARAASHFVFTKEEKFVRAEKKSVDRSGKRGVKRANGRKQ